MGTDRYAYASRLRRMDPVAKILFCALVLGVCLCCGGIAPGLATLLIMGLLSVFWGGVPGKVFLKFLTVPLAFLALGCLTIVVNAHPQGTPVLAGLSVGSQVWGITRDSAFRGLAILSKSLGAISAMYFLALNTPMTDVTLGLQRLKVPQLMIELMDLIYRFIFVLWDTAAAIRTAQDSRLGYTGFRRSISSLGSLSSMVFLRAWNKADAIYSALESRGYTGSLATMAQTYQPGKTFYLLAPAVGCVQLLCCWLEVRYFG